MKYDPSKIESKWQKYWEKEKLHETPDQAKGKKNFFLLTEFPYTSGDLHTGHWYAFALMDIVSRYLRMSGYNVLYPIGFDSFGLPAENAAIKNNLQPSDWTHQNINNMRKQLRSIGATLDWSREVVTCEPDYYKWTQWMFLQFYKTGLAYRANTLINWCPKDQTVLANEQAENGRCFRCGSEVIQKELTQWMLGITKYADRLIDDLDKVDYLDNVKLAQRNWIGRSIGVEIEFPIQYFSQTDADETRTIAEKIQRGSASSQRGSATLTKVKVFTTRSDTLFGATYLVLAPEHKLIENLKSKIENWEEVQKYIEQASHKTELMRQSGEKTKTGVELKGVMAINPANREKIPVWIADYVLGNYGTGAIMAVPAHDERDFEFAEKFQLPIKMVVCPHYPAPTCPVLDEAYTGQGHLVDSGKFDGLTSGEAKWKITDFVGGKAKTTYRLRDWVLSRQRYWGTPIPMIHCDKCDYQPVPEKDLPVLLPRLEDYKPSSDGRSPLAKATDWLKTKCPECDGPAERETDTMDTFVDSSWYFMRYTDQRNKKHFADPQQMTNWLPVDFYSGGSDHTTMHVLYSRFWTKALYDLGLLSFDEPYKKRRNRGWILGPDGQKMSKSRGNVIDPDEQVAKYGADTVRMFLAFLGPYEQGGPWDPQGINGVFRFLNRVWKFAIEKGKLKKENISESEPILSRAVKKIGEDIAEMKFNTGVSELMKLLNFMEEMGATKKQFETFILLLAPFAPHLAEEIWMEVLGHKKSVHLESWPEYDEKLLKEDKVQIAVQVNGKVRDVITVDADATEEVVKSVARESENIKKHISKSDIKKTIYVKGKVLNILV